MPRTSQRPSRQLAAVAVAVTVGLGGILTGCGGEAEAPTPSTQTSPKASDDPSTEPVEPQPEPTVIDVTFEGGTVDPSGERVKVRAGEEILLRITADAPGEIHVHSTPEQELAYRAGRSQLPLTIDRPGVVGIESHDLHLVIVQLEVR